MFKVWYLTGISFSAIAAMNDNRLIIRPTTSPTATPRHFLYHGIAVSFLVIWIWRLRKLRVCKIWTASSTMFHRTLIRATQRKPPPTTHIFRRSIADSTASSQSRIDRFNRRLPRFLHKYTRALGNAPLTHITSFLILHELTAIIPLFGLAGYFHYTHWLPPWFAEGAWVASGVERFGRYFKRKGWIRSDEAAEAKLEVEAHNLDVQAAAGEKQQLRRVDKAWNLSEGGVRLVVDFATAYAITKMFLVPRIMFSVWATPGFAKWTVIPVMARVKGLFGRGKKTGGVGGGAGTGAVEGGAVPKVGAKKS